MTGATVSFAEVGLLAFWAVLVAELVGDRSVRLGLPLPKLPLGGRVRCIHDRQCKQDGRRGFAGACDHAVRHREFLRSSDAARAWPAFICGAHGDR